MVSVGCILRAQHEWSCYIIDQLISFIKHWQLKRGGTGSPRYYGNASDEKERLFDISE